MSKRYLVVYDINEKRVSKVHKLLLRFLVWKQNSTFEGFLTNGSLKEMIRRIGKYVKKEDEDGVVIYSLPRDCKIKLEVLGKDKGNIFSNFIE
ncbi:CRISPR-associated protein, Cas2 family [Fervidobacterium changbaicum]|uniref:CRISPR-associated endoribonuclease Cas2 n=1 Tax=Fervidobacterium changbaicum TaxID=310769 RepID=A0ABX5QS70_9BACT|nr:CRISPR-associated endonuclease Cas2 [Fervidobacterium changbaicum]QAV33183.1 CRISPR-associated endonuclease Cas2 [Fervidobacterium changbaicum]SDH70784.1 CRISPR-associated protein, Cas2 family [Fervidobacterium changbaicum]